MSTIKEQMITNATKAVQDGGVNSITMRTLGNSVGIKSASVMYHFNNKDGLINEMITSYHQNFFNHLTYIDSTYDNPIDKLNQLVDVFIDVLNEDKFCLCGVLAMQNSYLNEDAKEKTNRFFLSLEKWVENVLKEGKIDTNLTMVIIASLEGALLIDQLKKEPRHLEKTRLMINGLKS